MRKRPLAVITTRLPPQVCGIGAYRWPLQCAWPDGMDATTFLVANGATESRHALAFEAIRDHHCDGKILRRELAALGDCDVLFDYAARAYHRFGVPASFVSALIEWRRANRGKLMVQFHETPSHFPPTSRHFPPNYLNARLVARLAAAADANATPSRGQAQTLRRLSGRDDVDIFPVGATIQPSDAATWKRNGDFVLFGLPFGRFQALRRFAAFLPGWAERRAIRALHVIGPVDTRYTREANALLSSSGLRDAVTNHGELEAASVSKILGAARFALVNATAENWAKSSVLMSAVAHNCGVVADIADRTEPLAFVIRPDEVTTIPHDEVEVRTRGFRDWFEANATWPVIARRTAALLRREEHAAA